MYTYFVKLELAIQPFTSRFQIINTSEDQEYWTPYNIRSPLFCPDGHRAVDSAFPLIKNLLQSPSKDIFGGRLHNLYKNTVGVNSLLYVPSRNCLFEPVWNGNRLVKVCRYF